MGRTVAPFSRVLEQERGRWEKFRRALRREDQEAFDRLFDAAKRNVQAMVYGSIPCPFEAVVMAVLLEIEKRTPRKDGGDV